MTAKVEGDGELEAMYGDWNQATYTPPGYTHPSSRTRPINGIFDREYASDDDRRSSTPNFRCKESEVSDIGAGAVLTILGEGTFTVTEYEGDGIGGIYLRLKVNGS